MIGSQEIFQGWHLKNGQTIDNLKKRTKIRFKEKTNLKCTQTLAVF
jgi:hypothetical protein